MGNYYYFLVVSSYKSKVGVSAKQKRIGLHLCSHAITCLACRTAKKLFRPKPNIIWFGKHVCLRVGPKTVITASLARRHTSIDQLCRAVGLGQKKTAEIWRSRVHLTDALGSQIYKTYLYFPAFAVNRVFPLEHCRTIPRSSLKEIMEFAADTLTAHGISW